MTAPRIGVLTLQGDFEAHAAALARIGVEAVGVRTPERLEGVDGLVIPGGESSALLKLMAPLEFLPALAAYHAEGGAIFGTCAGVILLAARVTDGVDDDGSQTSLGLLDVDVARNGYGRQRESFATRLEVPAIGSDPLDAIFIRAPRITRVGDGVDVLARHDGEPVLVRSGRLLGATFHPELTGDGRLVRYFVDAVVAPRTTEPEVPCPRV